MSRILNNVRAKRLPAASAAGTNSLHANELQRSKSGPTLAPVIVELDDTVTLASSLGAETDDRPKEQRPATKLGTNLVIAPASSAFATFKRFCRRAYRKLGLKHLLSVAVIVFYTVFGAGVFLAIEKSGDTDRLNRNYADYMEKRKAFVRTLAAEVTVGRTASLARTRAMIESKLQAYEDSIEFSVQNETDWNFWHAMYFAGTIYTTIGYGDIYCRTTAGRLFTMVYSLIGIPLVLSVLTDLGSLLLKALFNITRLYNNFVAFICPTGLCCAPHPPDPDSLSKKKEKKDEKIDRNNKTDAVIEMEEAPERSIGEDDTDDLDELERREADEYEYQLMRVPVLTALLATVGWIFACAALFCIWEDWTYFTSIYFFFISLSTIGLGDETPKRKDLMVSTYALVIIGLALVSMCITVIQRRLEDLYLQLLRMILQEYHKQLREGGDQMGATMGIMNMWSNNKAAKFLMPLLSKDKKQNVVQKFQDEAKAQGFAVPAVLRDLDPRTGVPAVLKVAKDKVIEGQAQLREAVSVAISRAADKAKARNEPNDEAALQIMYSLQARPPTPPVVVPAPAEPSVPTPPVPSTPIAYEADTQTEELEMEDKQEQTTVAMLVDAQTQSLDTSLTAPSQVDEASQTVSIQSQEASVQYEDSRVDGSSQVVITTIETSTQCDQAQQTDKTSQTAEIQTIDGWSQSEAATQADKILQTADVQIIDGWCQYEGTVLSDKTSQTATVEAVDNWAQYDRQEEEPSGPPPSPTAITEVGTQTEASITAEAFVQTHKVLYKDRVIQTHVYDLNHIEIQTDPVQTKNQRLQTPIPETLERESQTDLISEPQTPSTAPKRSKTKNNLYDIIKKAMANTPSTPAPTKSKLSSSSSSGLAPSTVAMDEQPAMASWTDVVTDQPPSSDEEEDEPEEEIVKRRQKMHPASEPAAQGPPNWRDQLRKVQKGDGSKRGREELHWDPIDGLHAEKQRRVSDLKQMFEKQKAAKKRQSEEESE